MSPLSIDELKKQLAHTETEFEQARATLYRCDGVIQVLKHLIASAEAPQPEPPVDVDVKES